MGLAAVAVSAIAVLSAPPGRGDAAPGTTSPYCVGAAKEDITPSPAMIAAGGLYLGGYGVGPQHPAHSVLRDLYARAIAIGVPVGGACTAGGADQVVIAADDLQGHFIAYQQGPYGFADMESHVSAALHIPVSHLLIQSTHTHNGPDDLGLWGGVPNAYLAEVTAGTETAIERAAGAEQLATIRRATIDMSGMPMIFIFGSAEFFECFLYRLVDGRGRYFDSFVCFTHAVATGAYCLNSRLRKNCWIIPSKLEAK